MARSTARTPAGAADRTPSRTLADQLRGWPDDRLSRLLRDRPDLATPAPQDSGQLASRAAARSSVPRALDLLTRAELCVVDALVAAGQTTQADLVAVVNACTRVGRGRRRTPGRPRPGVGVAGRPASGRRRGRPGSRRRPERGTGRAAAVLDRAAGARGGRGPAGRAQSPRPGRCSTHVDESGGEATAGSARHTVLPEDAATPAEELLARRLLVPRTGGQVWVPGEVSVALRGGHTTRERVDVVPTLATAERADAVVERTAAGAAFEVVRRVELLLDHWGSHPPAELRAGGLGVRELKAAAVHLHVDEPTTALLVEVAAEARLVAARFDDDGNAVFAPTDEFDAWTRRPTAERWAVLATAWLGTPRLPGLVGMRDAAGKAHSALSPENTSVFAAETRRMTLEQVAALPPGQVLAVGTGPASLVERLSWLRPRRPRTRAEQVAWALARGDRLGPGRPRRDAGVRAGAAGRRGRRRTARAVAARARRPRAAAGRPDRGRARPSRARPRPAAAGGGRGGVARRGDGLPLHRPVRTPRTRRRLDLRRAARLRRGRLAHAGAAAAQLPDRRHRPHLRHRPGRPRGGLRPGRRRGGAHRAPPPPAGRITRACGGWPRPC